MPYSEVGELGGGPEFAKTPLQRVPEPDSVKSAVDTYSLQHSYSSPSSTSSSSEETLDHQDAPQQELVSKKKSSRIKQSRLFSKKRKELPLRNQKNNLEDEEMESDCEASDNTNESENDPSSSSHKDGAKKARKRDKPYECGVCFRMFGCKSHVVDHMRTHTGEKPFECSVCHKRFSQKSNIYQHMNTHTMERPFSCSDCGKSFMYRGSLYKHKRLHTGERPYACGMCQKRFTHGSQLFEHMRTHTNERPFVCGVCGRAFAHSGTMHRHQRNHFKGQNMLKFGKINIDEKERSVEVEVLRDNKPANNLLTCTKIIKNGVEVVEGENMNSIGDINHNFESYTPAMLDQELRRLLKVKSSPSKLQRETLEIAATGLSAVTEDGADAAKKDADAVASPKDAFAASLNEGIGNDWVLAASINLGPKPGHNMDDTVMLKSGEVVPDFSHVQRPAEEQLSSDPSTANQPKKPSVGKHKAPPKLSSSKRKAGSNAGAGGNDGAEIASSDGKSTVATSTGEQPKRLRVETEDKKIFACNLCGRSFCHRRSVKRHKQAQHPEVADDKTVVVKAAPEAQARAIKTPPASNNSSIHSDSKSPLAYAESGSVGETDSSLDGQIHKPSKGKSVKELQTPLSIRLGISSGKDPVLLASDGGTGSGQFLVLCLGDHQVLVNSSAMLQDPAGTIRKVLSLVQDKAGPDRKQDLVGKPSASGRPQTLTDAELSNSVVDVSSHPACGNSNQIQLGENSPQDTADHKEAGSLPSHEQVLAGVQVKVLKNLLSLVSNNNGFGNAVSEADGDIFSKNTQTFDATVTPSHHLASLMAQLYKDNLDQTVTGDGAANLHASVSAIPKLSIKMEKSDTEEESDAAAESDADEESDMEDEEEEVSESGTAAARQKVGGSMLWDERVGSYKGAVHGQTEDPSCTYFASQKQSVRIKDEPVDDY